MITVYTVLLFMGLVLLAVPMQSLADRIKLPFPVFLVVLGYVAGEILISTDIDTGIRWYNFDILIFHVFLPVLIFESALGLDARLLYRNLLPVLFLSIPLMLLSAGITAVLIYYAIATPDGFPWIAAILTGAIVSATDPAAVIALFKKLGAPERITILVDGESLFNDALSILLFSIIIGIALSGSQVIAYADSGLEFLRIFIGGIVVGLVVGGLGYLLLRWFNDQVIRSIISLICAYSGYLLADFVFHVSGVMSVLMTGLVIGYVSNQEPVARESHFLKTFWHLVAWLASVLLFLISGMTVQISMFTDQWLAVLIGIFAVLISRAIAIFGAVPLLNALPGVEPVSSHHRNILFMGGIRGAVPLALALSLPLDLPYWWTIQSIVYGIVLFTLIVQAPAMMLLIKKAPS